MYEDTCGTANTQLDWYRTEVDESVGNSKMITWSCERV